MHIPSSRLHQPSTIIIYSKKQQSLEAINEIKVDEGLERDTAQLLYYYYMKGSGGMYESTYTRGSLYWASLIT